jgi:uncharacterized protein YkwD
MEGSTNTSGQVRPELATANQVLSHVNKERQKVGKQDLAVDDSLTRAAQKYAEFLAQKHNDLVNNQRLSDRAALDTLLPVGGGHDNDGSSPLDRAKDEGYTSTHRPDPTKPKDIRISVGENIAANQTMNAEQAVRQWMSSPGHRANMLSERGGFTLAGVGVASTASGVVYYVLVVAGPRS